MINQLFIKQYYFQAKSFLILIFEFHTIAYYQFLLITKILSYNKVKQNIQIHKKKAIQQSHKYISRKLVPNNKMNYNKNVKRSVTYQFQLTNSKFLPVTRYKGNSKLYQLNLSKMLMKCPESPFCRNIQLIENPQQLLIVSTSKYHHSSQKQKSTVVRHPINCKSQFSKTKAEKLKKNIKDNLVKQDKLQFQQTDFGKKLFEDDYNRTLESPNRLDIDSQQKTVPIESPNISIHSSKRNIRNQLIIVRQKKLYVSAVQSIKNQEQNNNKLQSQIINIKSTEKSQIVYENFPMQPLQKNAATKRPSFKISQNQLIKRAKISKKLLLPQIKQQNQQKNQSHTYNIGAKSNIPLLFRDPQQLKHIKAESYSIIQYPSGNLILSNKGSNQYEIASLTKIMTFYTILKILNKFNLSLDQHIKVTDSAMEMTGTSAQIIAGEVYTVEQLLYGLMLPSGNDAATALAQWGGKHLLKHYHPNLVIHSSTCSTKNLLNNQQNHNQAQTNNSKSKIKMFINQMNNHAKQLGLSSTRFANPHGLPHHELKSTAIDVARLCFQCMKDQFFKKVVSTHKFKCVTYHNNKVKRIVQWTNTNKLLRRDGFIGIKTGITVTAGPCLASAYKFRDKIYICVLLRATKISRRFKQTRKLLSWSLQKMYKQSLTQQQTKVLVSLRKNKPDLDSDYSEDQQQFKYDEMSRAEIKKRSNIINYQM